MKRKGQRGIAALEVALALPFLVSMIMVLIEVSNMLYTYQSVEDASREGARAYVRDGNSANISNIINSTMNKLPATSLNTTVTTNAAAKTVTVEVQYGYSSFFSANQLLSSFHSGPVTLQSTTTMSLP
ncbi:MAG: pilus assembly protein [Desulfovibrionaceae bacterium]|nr:pilus assembly protein [Desulfovibrionaceae bacterium]MBF0512880.1 pilus assembly protein [Desulfovibrionaceae bacterium]